MACRAKDHFYYLHAEYGGAFICPYMQKTHCKSWRIQKECFQVIIIYSTQACVEQNRQMKILFLHLYNPEMHLCPTKDEWGTHSSSLAQRLDLGLLCCSVFLWQREGGVVKLLDVICGIAGFDRGEQTSLSVTDGQTPKMPPDSKTTAIYKLQSTADVNWSQSP